MADTDFRKAMRESESSNRSGILNDISGGRQVMGAYQFGDARLADFRKATGEDFTVDQFLSDIDLQNRVMDWHEQDIMDYVMNKGLDQYMGQDVRGVQIDPAAVLAMAHLGGRSGMRQFIETGGEYDPADKFGTKISDYGKKFSGMNAYGLTPQRPKMRPEGLLDAAMSSMRSVRPKMRPKRGILD